MMKRFIVSLLLAPASSIGLGVGDACGASSELPLEMLSGSLIVVSDAGTSLGNARASLDARGSADETLDGALLAWTVAQNSVEETPNGSVDDRGSAIDNSATDNIEISSVASDISVDISDRELEQANSAVRNNIALWEEANAAYYANDFASASTLYDSIEESGMVSAKLYYNKAGALFKMGKIGESILYYSKAQRLAPSDSDIAHNLAIAGTYTRNHIEPVPDFFLKRWVRALGSTVSGNTWAWLSLVFIALTLTGILLYLLPFGRRIRKTGFYGGLSALVLLIFAFSFARRDWSETVHPTGGIVTAPSAAVKSSPDSSGKDLFLLYEGDRVQVLDAMNGWNEITVANGNRGWIRSGVVSMID